MERLPFVPERCELRPTDGDTLGGGQNGAPGGGQRGCAHAVGQQQSRPVCVPQHVLGDAAEGLRATPERPCVGNARKSAWWRAAAARIACLTEAATTMSVCTGRSTGSVAATSASWRRSSSSSIGSAETTAGIDSPSATGASIAAWNNVVRAPSRSASLAP
jgi:hypothetical protein